MCGYSPAREVFALRQSATFTDVMTVRQIASLMPAYEMSPEIQHKQTAARMEIAKAWGIASGAQVIEIGCGQGDMTAVLAALGASVLAVDPADASYGAPITLGDSTQRLAATQIGERIKFRLGVDPLATNFPDDTFDAVVFAHCSWYFASEDVLLQTLRHVQPWARRLLFSEWDLEPATLEQVAHLLAVTIQSQTEAFKPSSQANVRTPLSRSRVHLLLEESGWRIDREVAINTSGLDDGRWEIDACLAASLESIPSRLRTAVETQREVLRSLSSRRVACSLGSFALVAERG